MLADASARDFLGCFVGLKGKRRTKCLILRRRPLQNHEVGLVFLLETAGHLLFFCGGSLRQFSAVICNSSEIGLSSGISLFFG